MSDQQRKDLRARIIDVLSDAAAPDRRATEREFIEAGIPRRYAPGLARASRTINSGAECVEYADEVAREINAQLEADEQAVRDGSIINRISRI